MAIEELLALVAPPAKMSHAQAHPDWDAIERAVGTRLPTDYRAYATHYGSGRFDDDTYTFWVINPLSPTYLSQFAAELDLWRFRREAFPCEYPAAIFPAIPGLFPWGCDEDGGMMGWLVESNDPDQWPVVAKNRDESFERFDLNFSTFLAQSLNHRIRPRVWRPDYPEDIRQVSFRPDPS
ncbi:hypothetical protein VT84_11055 [Gemmata sp. SH-PL17]|uniref:SMI1/KNR4 family protein n=1 Tax=Gemmata sp. SH-PL17 TaxID=1630693 RepID=UPI00078C97D5|nr:SMI1/KNR4 family protein [Gemmata sp. SH-PL17]AMV24928.1 hypothetical protein VT84_11055 [Gemmata sp. SH-PL17]